MNLLITSTQKGTFYFINSRRVSKARFDEAKIGRRLDTFHTRISKTGTIRHTCHARQ